MVRYTVWRALGSERVQMSRQHLRGSETGRDSSREDHPLPPLKRTFEENAFRGENAIRTDGYFYNVLSFGCITSKTPYCTKKESVLLYSRSEGNKK